MKHNYTVMIGCDPEFVVCLDDQILPTSVFRDRYKRSVFGQENRSVLELRPTPCTSVIELVARIRRILIDAVKIYPFLYEAKWIGIPYYLGNPLGGHIHISWHPVSPLRTNGRIRLITQNVVDNIHIVLRHGIFPYVNGGLQREKMRHTYGYGHSKEFRIHTRRQCETIEYRTISTWLYSPVAAFLYLMGAQVATYAALYGIELPLTSQRGSDILQSLFSQIDNLPFTNTPDFKLFTQYIDQLPDNPITYTLTNFLPNWEI